MFQIPTSTSASLTANVTSLLADPGLLAVVLIVAGVPFGFYVIKKLIGLIPKK